MDLRKAIARVLWCMPYLAHVALSVRHEATEEVGTACVSPSWVLSYNPQFMDKLSPEEQAFILAHEYLHLLLDHAGRRGERDQDLWNVACDVVINKALEEGVRRGSWPLQLPQGALRAEDLGIYETLSAEEVYERLKGRAIRATMVAQGLCGSGAGGRRVPGERDDGLSPVTARARAEAARREAAGRGDLPGGLAREVGLASSPRVNWRALLAQLVRGCLAQVVGRTDYTFTRPSRRSGEVILPSLRRPTPRVAVVVDTSGSMGEAELAQAVAEVEGVVRNAASVTMLACDAAVHARGRVQGRRDAQKLLRGGGGTDMRVGLAEALKERPDLVVVLTDGYTPWPEKAPPVPVIVVLLGEGEAPAWAKTVRVEVGS